VRSVVGFFSYFNDDPANIRNQVEIGGGALMDIGCYPIHASRFVFGPQPERVIGEIDRDPTLRIDRLTSAILDFGSGQAIFTCSTQLVPYQRIHFLDTRGRIEIEIPFNAPERPSHTHFHRRRGRPQQRKHHRRNISHERSIHAARGCFRESRDREPRSSRLARGRYQKYGGHRGGVSLRGVGPVGIAAVSLVKVDSVRTLRRQWHFHNCFQT
jgi:predicted dehydrogenase